MPSIGFWRLKENPLCRKREMWSGFLIMSETLVMSFFMPYVSGLG